MGYKDIYELQALNGAKDKCEFIRRHSDDAYFRNFLYYALNPLLTYNLSEKTINKFLRSSSEDCQQLVFFEDIFDCCEQLSRLRGIDDASIRQVCILLNSYQEDERRLYIKLLSKTIRLGIASKTVNKVINGLIPEWEVQQAYPIDKYPLKEGVKFWVTQKLNGARATLYNGQLVARSGMAYKGLDHIINELSWIKEAGLVADGELTLKDKGDLSDNEAFRISTGILNSDSVNKTSISFTIFDLIPENDFNSSSPKVIYSTRRNLLSELDRMLKDGKAEYSKVLPVLYEGEDQSQIDIMLDKMVAEDKEGLVVNTDVPYKRTRHRGILKVKRFYTMDLRIIRCEEGTGRLSGTLGAVVVDYKGNEVNIGSGFTDEQREKIWNDKDSVIGELCEVKYKEISNDKTTGKESLQFPVFIRIRKDKTEVSYG